MSTTLIVPGLRSSGPTHWQTWLEHRVSGSIRVPQRDWNDAHLPDWASRVRREIVKATGRIFIAAHSFGALASVQAASDHAERVAGVLLVAPADPDRFGVGEFLPTKPLPFPAIVVASTNDPWISLPAARRWSERWRAELVVLDGAGHINAEAGFGPWPEALILLERLRRAAEFRSASERLAALSLSQSRPFQRHWLARRQRASCRETSGELRDLKGAAAALRAAGWTVIGPDSKIAGDPMNTPL